MPVKRRLAKNRIGGVSEAEWAAMLDRPLPPGTSGWDAWMIQFNPDKASAMGGSHPSLQEVFEAHEGEVLEEWINTRPGTRPTCWWKWTAPRHGNRPYALRQRLGGAGTSRIDWAEAVNLEHACLDLAFGIPTHWIDAAEIPWLRQRDPAGHLDLVPFDPTDPPVFEAQAAFLRRHSLLLPEEAERLTDADFEPEPVARHA